MGLVGLAAGSGSAANLPAIAAAPPAVVDDGKWLPIDLIASRNIVVPANINGRHVPAMIDSGATHSVISQQLALDMNLPQTGTITTQSFTDRVSGALLSAQSLEIGGFSFSDIRFDSFDTRGIEDIAGHRIPLIIGCDLLRRLVIEIDFAGSRMRFQAPRATRRWLEHASLPLLELAHRPGVSLKLEACPECHALIDLGSDAPVSMSADYARAHGLLDGRKGSTAIMSGIEGAIRIGVFTLDSLQVGPFRLRRVPAQVIDSWKLENDVSLGWSLFRAFDAVLDLGAQALRLKADNSILGSEFPKDRLGLFGSRQSDRLVVLHVAEGSPAWLAGVRPGDQITTVNKRPITDVYPERSKRLGLQQAGTSISLGLSNGRQYVLKLQDYF